MGLCWLRFSGPVLLGFVGQSCFRFRGLDLFEVPLACLLLVQWVSSVLFGVELVCRVWGSVDVSFGGGGGGGISGSVMSGVWGP